MRGGTIYLPRNSGLDSLHPLTKLALLFLCFACAAALPSLPWLLGFYIFALLPLALWGRLAGPFLKTCLTVVGPFVLSLAVIQGFFGIGDTVLFSLGRFTFKLEGLLAGLTVAARILVALGGTLLLMQSTAVSRLMLALTQRGFPQRIAYVVLTAIQIFPSFQDRAQVIMDAQQARGLELQVGFFKRAALLLPLIGPLILGSVVDVEERAMALEARAFSSPAPKTSLLDLPDSAAQRAARLTLVLAAAALLAWRLWSVLR
jgi:energy-coupling factor transport system permease protein